MANNITISPLVIDTAAATAITTGTFKINMIRWVSTSASAGDSAVVQNAASNTLWASLAAGANHIDETSFTRKPLIFVGLIVPTLTSGTLYLYVEDAVPIRT